MSRKKPFVANTSIYHSCLFCSKGRWRHRKCKVTKLGPDKTKVAFSSLFLALLLRYVRHSATHPETIRFFYHIQDFQNFHFSLHGYQGPITQIGSIKGLSRQIKKTSLQVYFAGCRHWSELLAQYYLVDNTQLKIMTLYTNLLWQIIVITCIFSKLVSETIPW